MPRISYEEYLIAVALTLARRHRPVMGAMAEGLPMRRRAALSYNASDPDQSRPLAF